MTTRNSVNNGRRITLKLGDLETIAGLVEKADGSAELAFSSDRRSRQLAVGEPLDADNRRWVILKIERPTDHKMTVLKLREVNDGNAPA